MTEFMPTHSRSDPGILWKMEWPRINTEHSNQKILRGPGSAYATGAQDIR